MIERCMHQDVCEFKQEGPEGECGLIKICKYYAEEEAEAPKRRGRAKVRLDEGDDEPKTSEAVFKRAKKKLEYLHKAGKLDENQIAALDSIKGTHFRTLTEPQKAQIVEMAETIKV